MIYLGVSHCVRQRHYADVKNTLTTKKGQQVAEMMIFAIIQHRYI